MPPKGAKGRAVKAENVSAAEQKLRALQYRRELQASPASPVDTKVLKRKLGEVYVISTSYSTFS